SLDLLLAALFLMGTHSTFFAPAKYGLLPEVLSQNELVGGNAMVEMGTFLAILLGTLAAGLPVAEGRIGLICTALLAIAALGFLVSLAIPRLRPVRSEEHTSELQSRENLVCRLLLEKKKKKHTIQ